jgi:hypothetical protein
MNKAEADVVEKFAQALDTDDYETAKSLLGSHCIYVLPKERIEGRDEIIQSFRSNSEWARSNLEKVSFEHSLAGCRDCSAMIQFTDLLEHAGQKHRHECLMHTRVSKDGLITKLTLEELPIEKRRLSEFLTMVGVIR